MENQHNHSIEGVIIRKLMAINWVKTHFLLFELWAISKTNRLLQSPLFRETFLLLLLYVCSQNHGLVLLLLDFTQFQRKLFKMTVEVKSARDPITFHFWCPELNLGILYTCFRVQAKTASPGAMFSFRYLAIFGFFSVSCSNVHSCFPCKWLICLFGKFGVNPKIDSLQCRFWWTRHTMNETMNTKICCEKVIMTFTHNPNL